jgi:hypothetical protein
MKEHEHFFVKKMPIFFLRWHQKGYQRYGTTEGIIHSFMLFGIALWIIPSRFNIFKRRKDE